MRKRLVALFSRSSFRKSAMSVPNRQGGGQRGESGQALLIVMGLVTMIFLGTLAVAQNVDQHYPIVQRDQIVHESYRAMQAGVNNYLSMANANPDTVICSATVDKVSNYPNPTTSSSSTPSLPAGSQLCSGFSTGTWISVPNLASTQGAAAWYLYGSPTIYYCTGGSSSCPQTVWVSMTVIGASKTGQIRSYTPGTITVQPQNGFLLNLWWLNYDQLDPTTLAGTQTCTWYWYNTPNSLNSGCEPVDFVKGETLTGNIFSNDPIFVCSDSNTSGGATVNGTVATHDSAAFVTDPLNCSGGGNYVAGTHPEETSQPFEQEPTDDVILGAEAAQNGCLYEGPTELQLAEYTGSVTKYIGTYGIDVTSPDTSTGGPLSTNDALDDSANASICIPSSSGGWVPYPKNGIDFVENCTSSDSSCTGSSAFDPMDQGSNDLYSPDDQASGWSGPTASATSGDAIIEGTEQGPLTIAAQNNIVITGDLCYASWAASGSIPCDSAPTNATSDVLGLIAYNYVVVNHPMTYTSGGGGGGGGGSWGDDSDCTSNEATLGSTTSNSGLSCDLDNPVIDAAILALNEQYFVSNWDKGTQLDNIYVNGSISEDWRGPVGTSGGSSGTGYSKQYTYDLRLEYLSPPGYLNPGTSSWQLGTISAVTGSCPSTITGCSVTP
jgi:hypothetical protein